MAEPSKFVRLMNVVEDALQFAPRPSIDDVIRRLGTLPQQVAPEEYLRGLARGERWDEAKAARAVDDAMTADTNVFGLPTKTISQGHALGARNLPGIENLSPEEQILLAQALNKGAMLRALAGRSPGFDLTIRQPRNWSGPMEPLPAVQYAPGNRVDRVTMRGAPFVSGPPITQMGDALSLLQNKREFRRAFGTDPGDLPFPEAFRHSQMDGATPAEVPRALGDDVSDLLMTVRQDKIDSSMMRAKEAEQAALFEEMGRSADEVARMEARAREYNGLPPETLSQMGRSSRSYDSMMSGQTERLTGDPTWNWLRQMSGNMDPHVADPLFPRKYDPIREGESVSEHGWRTWGSDLVKGMALGHVGAYPAAYLTNQYLEGKWPFGDGKTTGVPQAPPPPAMTGVGGQEEDEEFLKVADSMPKLEDLIQPFDDGLQAAEVPVVRTPETELAMPEEEQMAIDSAGDDAALAAESTPIPTSPDLDALFAESGMVTDSTSPEVAARRREVWRKMKAQDDLNQLMREAGVGGYDGDLKNVNADYLRSRGSVFSPDSMNYRLEQEYRRRGGNPYPQLTR